MQNIKLESIKNVMKKVILRVYWERILKKYNKYYFFLFLKLSFKNSCDCHFKMSLL